MVASSQDNRTCYKSDDDHRFFLSCDWGTSSFRLKLVESIAALKKSSGDHTALDLKSLSDRKEKAREKHVKESKTSAKAIAGISSNQGIKKIYEEWSRAEEPQNRFQYYCSFLKQQIADLQERYSQKFNDLRSTYSLDVNHLPIVISGMASSSIGMHELPYGNLPFSLDHPDVKSEFFEADDQFPHPVYLISGLRSSRDIMRGEETELVGLFSAARVSDGLYLLAGTHSKHIRVQNSVATDFKTYMTGELFELLASKSILSNSVGAQPKNGPGPAFKQGVTRALNDNILHELFTIRSRDVLNQSNPAENYDYLSGLLIGAELKDIKENHTNHTDKIVLAGSDRLQQYYAAALQVLDLDFIPTDSSTGENITPLGHIAILSGLGKNK